MESRSSDELRTRTFGKPVLGGIADLVDQRLQLRGEVLLASVPPLGDQPEPGPDERYVEGGIDRSIVSSYFLPAASHSSASRYPAIPFPMIRCAHTSAMTLTCRHASRFDRSEMCTSTTRSLVEAIASRSA